MNEFLTFSQADKILRLKWGGMSNPVRGQFKENNW